MGGKKKNRTRLKVLLLCSLFSPVQPDIVLRERGLAALPSQHQRGSPAGQSHHGAALVGFAIAPLHFLFHRVGFVSSFRPERRRELRRTRRRLLRSSASAPGRDPLTVLGCCCTRERGQTWRKGNQREERTGQRKDHYFSSIKPFSASEEGSGFTGWERSEPRLGAQLCRERRGNRGETSAGRAVAILPEPGGGRKNQKGEGRAKRVSLAAGRPGAAGRGGLFVRPEEAGDFGAQEFDEGAGQHLLVLLCVLEVVLGVCQHVEESFDELLVLQGSRARGRFSIPPVPCSPEAPRARREGGIPERKDALGGYGLGGSP